MRWLYHVVTRGEREVVVGAEGFVHCSYRDAVAESARLYFVGADVEVLQIDPRRLDARTGEAATPRGPMPHLHGEVARDAVRAVLALDDVATAPDAVTGTRFVFVAFDGMTLLDLVGMHDPLSRIRTMGIDPTSTCEIVGLGGARVWAQDGASVAVDRVRPALGDADVVLVPGGFGTRTLERDLSVAEWLATFPPNRLAASVCTGALLLGAAGRLRGKRATTHASALDHLAEYGATAVRERVVDEGQLVTAGGVTSALDLGLHIVRRLHGDEAAAKIAAQMEYRGGR